MTFLFIATYRIPLIDIDAVDLLPIHYFIDPGPDFAWPIDEELSDEKIHLYTHFGESRVETLENYLSLSKEYCPLNTLIPPLTTTTNNNNDDNTSTADNNSTTTNVDLSISTNETNSITTPTINKKLSRSSFNSFSKIIRRTFIEPFSSVKRTSLKQQRQNPNLDTSDTSMINENEHIRRTSSPLLNRRTNILTIIVTNFQPKRPKTCDNMIKNYIDACMNEYKLEKNRKQMNDISINENDNNSNINNYSDWNNDLSSYQQPIVYNRYHSSINTNRYQQNISSNEKFIETSGKKLPSIPINSTTKGNISTKHIQQKKDEIDDNDESLPMENGQFSSHINYVQQTQRKSSQLTQVREFELIFKIKHFPFQSNSLEMSQGRHHYPDGYVNGISSNRSIKTNPSIDSSTNRTTPNVLPSTFQPGLKRQPSLGYDKNLNIQRIPDSNINNRGSIKTTINNNTNQSKRSSNGSSRISNIEQQKRF